jgi:hypothetical protein
MEYLMKFVMAILAVAFFAVWALGDDPKPVKPLTEADIRAIVRDELKAALAPQPVAVTATACGAPATSDSACASGSCGQSNGRFHLFRRFRR